MTPQKHRSAFPFEMIVLRVRFNDTPNPKCLFCQHPALYVHEHFVENPLFGTKQGGMIDMDRLWSEAIRRQMKGNYQVAYWQPICDECCVHFATIQLGKRNLIQQLLSVMSLVKRQQGIDLSMAIMCTVKSLMDEGDTWVMNAPDGTAEDVVRHVTANKKP